MRRLTYLQKSTLHKLHKALLLDSALLPLAKTDHFSYLKSGLSLNFCLYSASVSLFQPPELFYLGIAVQNWNQDAEGSVGVIFDILSVENGTVTFLLHTSIFPAVK